MARFHATLSRYPQGHSFLGIGSRLIKAEAAAIDDDRPPVKTLVRKKHMAFWRHAAFGRFRFRW